MRKKILDVASLSVESFDSTSDAAQAEIGNDWQCTGCDSGCGIIWP